MDKLTFYWEFHKSSLIVNWAFSITLSLIVFMPILIPIMSMTGGPLLSIFHKELTHKNEYYFYYNRGISKTELIVSSLIMNMIAGVFILLIFYYVKYS